MTEALFSVRNRQSNWAIHRLIVRAVFDVGESNAEYYYSAVLQASASRDASECLLTSHLGGKWCR